MLTPLFAAARLGDVTQAILDRIEKALKERGLTESEFSRRAGLGRTWFTTTRGRVARGEQKGFTAATLQKVAAALGVPEQTLLGAPTVNLETPFLDLVQWAHGTQAIARVLALHEKRVTVGDLLRYRATPSSRGQFDADEVWKQIVALRVGIDMSPAVDVTEEEEAAVGPRKRKPKR